MKLTKIERLLLINQYRILGMLNPEDKQECADKIEALDSGFENECNQITASLSAWLDEDGCNLVLRTMTMFRELHSVPGGAEKYPFYGFDGNNEFEHMAYARYLVDKGAFDKNICANPDMNSHGPSIEKYSRMLNKWGEFSKNYIGITPERAEEIWEERILPSSR